MNTAERLEKLRGSLALDWTKLCLELGIKRTMLHYLRTGEQSPSMRLEKIISALEGKARLRSYTTPGRSVLSRLRFFGPHCQWSDEELATRLSLSAEELKAIFACKRELSPEELKRLCALEDEYNISLPPPDAHGERRALREAGPRAENNSPEPDWVVEFRGRLERIEALLILGEKKKAVRYDRTGGEA